MLKLILTFRSLLEPQAFLSWRTYFFQLKQQLITYFLSITQWKIDWNKYIFKKSVTYELRGLFI